MKTSEIKIVLGLFVSVLIMLSALGFAGRAELQASAPPRETGRSLPQAGATLDGSDASALGAHWPAAGKTPVPSSPDIASPQSYGPPQIPEPASSQSATSGLKCPLSRVEMVRGSDSEASEGGGFYAARKNGIHGAVDLDGSVGEAVFAVANGKVIVAGDWGKLGKAVILDHQDGGHTIYGHLHTVEVSLNSAVTAGQMIGTMGYSGNARALQAKRLPPHLHFAYVPRRRVARENQGFRRRSRSPIPTTPRAGWGDGCSSSDVGCRIPQMLGGSDSFKAFRGCYALMQHAPTRRIGLAAVLRYIHSGDSDAARCVTDSYRQYPP